jgi:membrane-bound lytic murein transglycosylase D
MGHAGGLFSKRWVAAALIALALAAPAQAQPRSRTGSRPRPAAPATPPSSPAARPAPTPPPPSPAAAPAAPPGEPDPLDALVTGEESPELRALRMMELELFGRAQPLVEAPDPASRMRVSSGPPAVTSDVPQGRAESAAVSRDVSWMRGLTLPDIPVRWDDRVVRYLEFFRDDPRGQRFIRGWVQRLHRYGPTVRETLERQGLPRDLLFVAMVESGFDPTARSHAGAVGMWQFMEQTGVSFDLEVDHWIDLRLDPERSTDAAGRYLAQLHGRFGTWELALAAYNMGYGALLRSIRKYNTNDFWTLARLEAALPFETTLYVAKIVACAIVAHNPERFGLTDVAMEEPIRWETVEVQGGVTLAQIARAAGTTVERLRALNPALRRGRTPPGRETWPVRLPPESAAQFAERWARARPTSPPHRPRVLRFGETLADLAREVGASEPELRELNGVLEDERVGAGTTLLVPAGRRRAETSASSERPVVAVPEGPREIPGRRRVFYRAVRGDRVAEIARFFRVREDELRQWNRIDPDAQLQPGMFLQVFVRPEVDLAQAVVLTPDQCRVLVVGSEEFFEHHEAQNGRVRFRYRVRPGETLSHLAVRFGLSVGSLMRINQIARDTALRAGEDIIVYADRSRVPPELLPDAAGGDALAPGGEATVERSPAPIEAPVSPGLDAAETRPEADPGDAGNATEVVAP